MVRCGGAQAGIGQRWRDKLQGGPRRSEKTHEGAPEEEQSGESRVDGFLAEGDQSHQPRPRPHTALKSLSSAHSPPFSKVWSSCPGRLFQAFLLRECVLYSFGPPQCRVHLGFPFRLHSISPSFLSATHLEALLPGREVDRGNVNDLLVLALCVVAEEGEGGDDRLGRDVEGELVLVDGELLNVFRQAGGDVLSKVVQRRVDFFGLVRGVDADGLVEDRGRGLGCEEVVSVSVQVEWRGHVEPGQRRRRRQL